MSRVVEQKMARAWNAGVKARCSANTYVVRRDHGTVEVRLHGHCIAKRLPDGEEWFSLCGWNTMTTRSRLNSLLNGRIFQHKGDPFVQNGGHVIAVPTHEPWQEPRRPAMRWITNPLDALTLALLAKQKPKSAVYSDEAPFHARCAQRRTRLALCEVSNFTLDPVIGSGNRCYVCYKEVE